jgi:hypothetical protein
MVASHQVQQASLHPTLATLRSGFRSLTITGPFPALEETHRQALDRVRQLPTPEERESAITQAWQASSQAAQLLRAGQHPQAAQAMQDMYSHIRAAIAGSRKVV